MEKAVNRVLLAFKSWEDRKKEIEPLLKSGTADVTMLSRLQLDHLRHASHRLRSTARPDEKPFMLLLNNQIFKLEKQLYPNLLRRIFSQLKDRLFDGPAYLKKEQLRRDNNMANLKIQLKEAGLGSIAGRLEQHLDEDQKHIRVPLDCQLGPEKRISLDLHFEKDPYGDFQLNRIGGSLLQNGKITKAQEFELNDWPNLKTNQIWSLLEGRAMKQQYTDASGHENHRWVELGPNGVQHYDPEHAFDVKTALAAMPAIIRNKEELTRYLENGQQVPTYWKQGKQYQNIYVQADPANRCIKLLDDKLRPITAEKLNQNLARQGFKVKTLDTTAQKTIRRVKNGQHQ
ncbi:hypothetical protein KXD93_30360 [Mucilaginibacter sp. BJC16-A38]|uniref:hypothetical protein n=1 Tax=Mucilaginibacter phenanthrenivorans TaxID=1234842 RepID=UPI00215702AB|nr:hypothetical protein [Mucilaginibacter phenanthrenivorans]MCR8561997.1 hypothetical protein [Mucilaginibacter phenanthrenivorans]